MPEGWWVSLALAGFPLSVGLLVYLLWRDKARKEREEAQRLARSAPRDGPRLEELEKEYGEKG